MARRTATEALAAPPPSDVAVDFNAILQWRTYQGRVLGAYQCGIRRYVAIWHRRAGKDLTFFALTLMAALQRGGNYFHVFPKLTQARKDFWRAIDGQQRPYLDRFPKGLIIGEPNETEMLVKLRLPTMADGVARHSTWQLIGADDEEAVDRLRGANPVGIVFSEAALIDPIVWRTLSPVLAENGGWAAWIGTPKGENHLWEMYLQHRDDPAWYAELLTVEQTLRDNAGDERFGQPVIDQAAIEQERREGAPEEFIQQEYYCSPQVANVGAYYGAALRQAELEGRITAVPYDPRLLVKTAWDLGGGRNNVIWFYQTDRQGNIRIIDYHEGADGDAMPQHVHAVKERRAYNYSHHTAPHDAAAKSPQTGKTMLQAAAELKLKFRLARRLLAHGGQGEVQQGIDLVTRLFPRMWFDAEKCKPGLVHLKGYVRRKSSSTTFEDEPDPACKAHSHAADALRYLAVDLQEGNDQPAPPRVQSSFSIYDHERRGGRMAVATFDPYGRV
jgi:phage terminase large subunit